MSETKPRDDLEARRDRSALLLAFDRVGAGAQALRTACSEQAATLSDAELLAALELARDAERTLVGVSARLAAEVEHRSTPELGQNGLAARQGEVNGGALVRRLTGSSLGESFRRIRIGRLVDGSGDAEGVFEALRSAVERGSLDPGGASEVVRALERIRPHVGDGELRDAVGALTRQAEADGADADELCRRARELRDEIDRDHVADREAALWRRRSLRFGRAVDGMTPVHGLLPPESAAAIKGAFDQAMSPKLGGPRFVEAGAAARAEAIARDERTAEQLRHDVLLEIVAIAKAHDDRHLLLSTRPSVVVHVPLSELVGLEDLEKTVDRSPGSPGGGQASAARSSRRPRARAARLEGSDEPVSVETARRILCDTALTSVLVDEHGEPLKIGGDARLFDRRQRRALELRDGGCRFPGCDRPPSWTEAHHILPWRDGGRSEIRNGVLLCRHHHRLVHHHGWEILPGAAGGATWRVRPPSAVDPLREPREMPAKIPGFALRR